MKHYALLYIATAVIITFLDLTWIGGIARNFYKSRIENLEFHAVPAILFYLMYVVGIVVFVNGDATSWKTTLLYGALFGFFCYATYDLTNLATLKNWSTLLALIDIAWGSVVTAVASTAGLLMVQWFERS